MDLTNEMQLKKVMEALKKGSQKDHYSNILPLYVSQSKKMSKTIKEVEVLK